MFFFQLDVQSIKERTLAAGVRRVCIIRLPRFPRSKWFSLLLWFTVPEIRVTTSFLVFPAKVSAQKKKKKHGELDVCEIGFSFRLFGRKHRSWAIRRTMFFSFLQHLVQSRTCACVPSSLMLLVQGQGLSWLLVDEFCWRSTAVSCDKVWRRCAHCEHDGGKGTDDSAAVRLCIGMCGCGRCDRRGEDLKCKKNMGQKQCEKALLFVKTF